MEDWKLALHEFVTHPDPLPWYVVPQRQLRMSLDDRMNSVMHLYDESLIDIAGIRARLKNKIEHGRRLDVDVLYAPTAAGRALWESEIAGKVPGRRGDRQVSRHSVARIALALGPRDVFDLPRAPWSWDRAAEQMAEFGEAA
jgi:hypothetical protein